MSQSQSSSKRMSIQERIRTLQSSGCCLETNHQTSQSGSSHAPSKVPSLNDSVSSLDLSTVTQEPLSPCDDNDGTNHHRSVVSFADVAQVCLIPQLDETVDYDSLYYTGDELADFRHEAFLESCGLTDFTL